MPTGLDVTLDRLIPSGGALVEQRGENVAITRLTDGARLVASGALAHEVIAYLERSERGPILAALDDGHPSLALLDDLRVRGTQPLDAASAVALDGFDTLFLELVGRCNERCVHCYADSGPQVSTALTLAECETAIDDAAALGFRRVQLTGGDPLLCGFAADLVEQITAHGMRAEIYTNGLLLSEAFLDRVAAFRPQFAISFYSHRVEVHDAITQTPGSQHLTIRALERLVARGLPLRVSIIVMPENAADLGETVRMLRALGVKRIYAAAIHAVGRSGERFEPPPDPIWTELAAGVHTGAADRTLGKLAVASDGAVYPCIFNRTMSLGNVRDGSLREIARAPRPPRRLLATLPADEQRLQCHGCRLTAQALRACGWP